MKHNWSNEPYVKVNRSTFNKNKRSKTTFKTGDLVPFYVEEVLPGDTFKVNTKLVERTSTMSKPVMDNAWIDYSYYFGPNRLVWDNWVVLMGENTTDAWATDPANIEVPSIKMPVVTGWTLGGLADQFGLPVFTLGNNENKINHLPFRAYCLIWNEWYRDQNLQKPILIDKGNGPTGGLIGTNTEDIYVGTIKGGGLAPVNKYHDVFTSALPGTQKGDQIKLPLGDLAKIIIGPEFQPDMSTAGIILQSAGTTTGPVNLVAGYRANAQTKNGRGVIKEGAAATGTLGREVFPVNMYADLKDATGINVNDLREAVQLQKLLEKDARGGTRYTEMLEAHFGVVNPDSRLQRPEYLGGENVPLGVHQVAQTSATEGAGATKTTPLGEVSAYSLTNTANRTFNKSFTEHGFVIGVMSVRTKQTYQNKIDKMWSKKDRLDYYHPVLANIGEQPILKKEIFTDNSSRDQEVFGYQEAHYEYRYSSDEVKGMFRSNAPQPIDFWHYANDFAEAPVLGDAFIRETERNMDRTLAIKQSIVDQHIIDILVENKATRPMPLYSIPGLIDHN